MLELSFILLLTYITAWFSKAISYSSLDKTVTKKRITIFISIIIVWCIYVYIIGHTGVIKVMTLPPRMPLFLILPTFATFAWFFITKRGEPYFKTVPVIIPVFFQSFRIFVELIIFWCFVEGFTTYETTFEGYNYEIYFGASALAVAFLVAKKKLKPQFLILWNFIGLGFLAVIVGIFTTLFFNPALWGYTNSVVNPDFMVFPYMLIPSVFMPCAVFVHIFSIIQNRKLLKSSK